LSRRLAGSRTCPLNVNLTVPERTAIVLWEHGAPKTRVQEVASAYTGLHIFVVRTDERERYERAQRLKAMERMKTQLDARCSI
jgi:hypothetical protein